MASFFCAKNNKAALDRTAHFWYNKALILG